MRRKTPRPPLRVAESADQTAGGPSTGDRTADHPSAGDPDAGAAHPADQTAGGPSTGDRTADHPSASDPDAGAAHPAYPLLHADAVRLLLGHDTQDPQQELLRLDLLQHLAAHPDAMARSGPPTHFTASCFVLDATLERVLLTYHRKAHEWLQLGGHLEVSDLSVRAGAAREAREESGLDHLRVPPLPVHLDRHRLAPSFGRCEEHLDIRYAALAPDGARPRVSAESLDVQWWPVNALPEGTRDELTGPVNLARLALSSLPGQGRLG